jgi:hypothetical protein
LVQEVFIANCLNAVKNCRFCPIFWQVIATFGQTANQKRQDKAGIPLARYPVFALVGPFFLG